MSFITRMVPLLMSVGLFAERVTVIWNCNHSNVEGKMVSKNVKKSVVKAKAKKVPVPRKKSFLSNFKKGQIDKILRVVCMTENELNSVRGTPVYDLTNKAIKMVKTPNDFCELFGSIDIPYAGHIGYERKESVLSVKTVEMMMLMIEVGRPMIERSHGFLPGIPLEIRDKIFNRTICNSSGTTFRKMCFQYRDEIRYLFDIGFLDAKLLKVFDAPTSKFYNRFHGDTKSVYPSWCHYKGV